ncbi:hypothetical protein [Kitasatospora sp. NPDC088346]|uniref:hypothetical protein n=1 Tax=Kitasatospora sp. NPDC088346 TaxID=3364073 RepID=UPI0037F16862
MKDFRTALSCELAAVPAPPLGDVVRAAVRDGRRGRRLRELGAVAGSAVALAGLAVVLALLPAAADGSPRPAGGVVVTPSSAPPTASPLPRLPARAEAVLRWAPRRLRPCRLHPVRPAGRWWRCR